MRVGWLQDNPGYVGGAELTAQEFRAAAPEDVEIVDCPSGGVVPDLDRYLIFNCTQYGMGDLLEMGDVPCFKYLNDTYPNGDPQVRQELLAAADLIFCSPLQRERMGLEGEVIPPALDLARFRPNRQTRRNTERKGTCSIAQWRNPGKGAHLLEEWSRENDTLVHVYGPGDFIPTGPNIDYLGPLDPANVPQILWEHETFVFLPFELEPFCRSVVEAHYAGTQVVTNGLIGASYWLSVVPEKLETAAQDFWGVVLGD